MKPGECGHFDQETIQRDAPALIRLLHSYFRADVAGLSEVPDKPLLFVGNHSGAAMIPDTLVWIAAYLAASRKTPLCTLAHDGMFDAYPSRLAAWMTRMGALRASHERALHALQSGFAVQVYPGGDDDACRSFRRRHEVIFAGRTGYVALAREANVPIVPVVSIGAHEALCVLSDGKRIARLLGLREKLRLTAFPLTLSLPWGLWLGPLPGYVPLPTKVVIRALTPIDPYDGSIDDVDAKVRASMQQTMRALAAQRRFPVIG
jgi:1-acyl-sn-glycerol-3-phosphate acyltransferase